MVKLQRNTELVGKSREREREGEVGFFGFRQLWSIKN